jgi:DNA invertase Pin-like site-specific DNA recombinase
VPNPKGKRAAIYDLGDKKRRGEQLRAAVYGRNSHVRRGGAPSLSVDSQLDECDHRIASQPSWTLIDVPGNGGRGRFRDDGISASQYARNKQRPDWQRLMELISAGEVDILVTWEISRATRDRPVWAALMAACQEHNVLLDVGGTTYDPRDPDEGFMLDLQAALAVRESGVTNKRVNRLVRARAQSGRPHGLRNYGYRSVYDESTGKLLRREIDPDTAEVVREIARRTLAGESRYAIAKNLNERGIPSPGGAEWQGGNMGQMIIRPAYAGLRVFQGEVIGDASWPAIIDRKDHFRLVSMLQDPERHKFRQDTRVKHLLVGIAECGKCKKGRARVSRTMKNPPNLKYNCGRNFCFTRSMERVDELIETLMKAWLSRDDVHRELAKLDSGGEASSAAAEAAELRARLERFYSRAANGQLSDAGLARLESELLPQIDKAEQRAKPSVLPAVVYKVAGPNPATPWDDLDILEKRAVIKALCRVIIQPSPKRGRYSFDPRYVEVQWLSGRQDGKEAGTQPGDRRDTEVDA